jgi:hypothetical protein
MAGNLGALFVRVSTGSQDESSQIKIGTTYAAEHGIVIVKTVKLHGYSASHGTQEPALREVIADMQRGDYSTLIVTESSRLDRREDLDAQAEILLAIRSAGGDVVSVSEPQFGKTDFAGRIVTLVAQHANAEKSRTVKVTTYRGIMMVRDNKAFKGSLPKFWQVRGERYRKQAYCADPDAVRDIYERIAGRESIQSVARRHDLYAQAIKYIVRFPANHTGVIECAWTYEGATETWAHEVEPVVDSALWWRANRVLSENLTDARGHRGGRPVAQQPSNWLTGALDCPGCGSKLYMNAGKTGAGNPRVVTLRCSGDMKARLVCGRFRPVAARLVADAINAMFSADQTPILAFQRVAGNAHELDELNAQLRKIQARLSATEDDDELDALIAQRKAVKARIEGFAVVPDSFDYAPTGQTVAQMWNGGNDAVKRGMLLAVKASWGMTLADHEGQWGIAIGTAGSKVPRDRKEIADLGNGLCFRR